MFSRTISAGHRLSFPAAAGLFVLAALALIPSHASAAALPLANGGANIYINFTNPNEGRVFLIGGFPSTPGLNLAGMQVDVNLSGFTRTYTLNANGQAIRTVDLFELRDNGTEFQFSLNSLYDDLLETFAAEGVANATITALPVTLNLAVTFNGNTYSADLTGTYDAIAGKTGKLFLGVIKRPKDPFKPIVRFHTVRATPNPTVANQPVLIKGTVNLSDFTGRVHGHLHFGDFTTPVAATGKTFETLLKDGIAHTYTADGIYTARLTLEGDNEIAETHFYVVVGKEYVVNSRNGAISQLVKSPGGAVTLNLFVDNIPGAVNAQTTFKDLNGNPAGVNVTGNNGLAAAPAFTTTGLSVSTIFLLPGIYIAESEALDNTNAHVGRFRTTIPINLADLGMSLPANTAAAGEAPAIATAPRDSASDNLITFTSMTGKFVYSSSTAIDKITFNGSVGLPAGYTPNQAAGNDITLSMGNVIDTVHLDSKGHMVKPSTLLLIKSFRLKVPKLTNGVALGGESAKLSMMMEGANLDLQGFDSDGISVSIRADEEGQTSVARFIQVAVLISGQSYSVLAPVNYALKANDAFGNVQGRGSH